MLEDRLTCNGKDEIVFTCKKLIMQPTHVDFDFKEEVLVCTAHLSSLTIRFQTILIFRLTCGSARMPSD